MTDNNDPIKQFDLEQMQVTADFHEALDNALMAVRKLCDTVVYLNFNNPKVIQSYFTGLENIAEGFNGLKEAFFELAASHKINLERNK